ncbi:2-deoxyglucose-6-phosphate phosphatase 2 [Holotrichia oblita]|uniref:2-deoxyglucose-6-phosphate phosphatase 2 n=1 Tax=Holotrichia oblita TaxID=644536 RepID=A0ACB9TSS0_HOLOL|nr:2-deoxyglucose-6-phosphate phosphatase 2 [Holotrichia oblita]
MKKALLSGILLRTCKRKYTLKHYRPVTHCIFDLDGTLLATDSVYIEVYRKMLAEHGKILTEDLLRIVSAMTNENSWKTSVKQIQLNVPWRTLAEEYEKRTFERLGHCKLMPGVQKLLLHLHRHEIPMAIASSTAQHLYRRKSAPHTELFKVFHHVVCGRSDPAVTENKPDPEIFTVCMDRFEDKPKPCDCLIFEDTLEGLSAAIDAGSQCVVIPPKGVYRQDFRLATLILNSLEEFQPELFGLPKYNSEAYNS